MITKLSIKNFALIDDVSIAFDTGFTTITGETGAGKSIFLGALSLLLGKRADLSSIKDLSKKCSIEAEFILEKSIYLSVFNENNLDFDTHTIVRRELLPSGKSRAFVNDTPVNLNQLQALAPFLTDIHNQYDTLSLFSDTFQMELLDVLANNLDLLKKYSLKLKEFNDLSEVLTQLKYKKETEVKELDYNTFLYQELTEANLNGLDQKKLEESYEILSNSELIQESLSQINHSLSSEQIGSIETLKEVRGVLSNLKIISSEFETLWNRIDSVIIELEDLMESVINSESNLESDPKTLYELNSILENLYRLQKKHNVTSVAELLEIEKLLLLKIESSTSLESKINSLELDQNKTREIIIELGKKLHNRRNTAIPVLIEKTTLFLNDLELPNAQLKIELNDSMKFKNNGLDDILVLFTANKGLDFAPLKKIASGGELSRIMLSVKAVLAQFKKMPTLIFDEIDTGISGEIANKMATILKKMSHSMQLICITHLPQIAAAGDHHIKIFKEDDDDVTVTRLKLLNKVERVNELAEMIGGKKLTKAAINHAKELLN